MPEEPDSLEVASLERVGRTLCDKWTLEALLGVGGVAAVYAARHRNGRRVAIKVLHPELSVDSRMRKRFLREGYVANKVEHSGAVGVLDDAVDADGTVFLVMELLDGETLEARCQRHGNQLPATEALIVAHGLLDVLACAHDSGVLHRDITPANVFITRDGVVKLLDFGIARLREPQSDQITGSVPGALGTPGFMAPEQARGLWDQLDARSDLWAVGAVLYRVLAGRAVHLGRTPSELLLAAMTKRAESLARTFTQAPDVLVALVDKAVAFEPDERFPDARSLQQAVGDVYLALAGEPIEKAKLRPAPAGGREPVDRGSPTQAAAFGTTVPSLAPAKARKLRPSVVAAALGLCLVGSVAIVWTREKDPPQPPAPRPEPAATSVATPPTEEPRVVPAPPASVSSSPRQSPPRAASSRAIRAPALEPKPKPLPPSEDDVLNQRR